jgi:hypothetical protein
MMALKEVGKARYPDPLHLRYEWETGRLFHLTNTFYLQVFTYYLQFI